jgi:segregation and condensation protein B
VSTVETEEDDVEGPEADDAPDLEAANIEESPPAPETFEQLAARGESLTPTEVRLVLQSLLLVADRPLGLSELHDATGIPETALQSALTLLEEEWHEGRSGVVLLQVGEGWQLRTEPSTAEYVRRLLQVKPQRLTRPALETLAVVAYRQPVTRPEIEDVRGVDCGAVLKALLERRLVKILGKKEEVGRPLLYGTTREFLEFFALRDLSGLPTLREFHELSEEHRALVARKEAPRPSPAGTVADLADPAFVARMEAQEHASQEALGALEAAMSTAEAHARAAAQALTPKSPEPSDGP